ncbi:hypothetical protein M3O96_02940 [Aquiflexum sp. TKW24L]|uniref:hypothetical protein n=1 Tax=Aquiflexum sp. TKW24L TaxID=2942212 RepID=UPI0020BE94CB|nr:hypothetical protein [Aquiflexum sp. TKW24L]MCL6258026.1 hypothetical protein [Aquiflexum sp. TKW24L]
MEIFFTLALLTIIYSLFFLSIYPDKYLKKVSHISDHRNVPEYSKFALSGPIFFSFLLGYSLAATMVFLFIL